MGPQFSPTFRKMARLPFHWIRYIFLSPYFLQSLTVISVCALFGEDTDHFALSLKQLFCCQATIRVRVHIPVNTIDVKAAHVISPGIEDFKVVNLPLGHQTE